MRPYQLWHRLRLTVTALVTTLVVPAVANACPVCFQSTEQNREAFIITAVFMTFMPLALLFAFGLVLRHRHQANAALRPVDSSRIPDTPAELP